MTRRRQVREALGDAVAPRWVLGCPDPHVERWLFADLHALGHVVGGAVRAPETANWKSALAEVVAERGVFVTRGPLDIAPDVVMKMDLALAEREDQSFGRFVSDLRAACRLVLS